MAKKSAEEVLEELRKFLWWDYESSRWKTDEKADWNGYDELDQIVDILIENGFGNPGP